MSGDSNAGAATPFSLYKLYSKQAAATANPYTLRQVGGGLNFNTLVHSQPGQPGRAADPARQSLLAPTQLQLGGLTAASAAVPVNGGSARRRDNSPPRASFRVLSSTGSSGLQPSRGPGLTISLTSLR